ncbi:MAG: OB-fold nucleic acid binding domain-containing protein [Candidatus Woesearchaeota archaeon]
MIKIAYEDILNKIHEKTGKSHAEIELLIKERQNQLSGLITKQGAAQIVASELGIHLYQEYMGKVKISKIIPGMRNLEVVGKILRLYPPKGFQTKDGREGKVASLVLGDETGSVRVVFWNDLCDLFANFHEGDILRITQAASRLVNGAVELQVFSHDSVSINPTDEEAQALHSSLPKPAQERKFSEPKRVFLKDLLDDQENIEVLATIVGVFEPRSFETCPQCGKRIRKENDGFRCITHGVVEPQHSAVMTLILDDGTGTIRATLFKNQANALLSFTGNDVFYYLNNPQGFAAIKDALLGEYVRIVGKSIKSEAFERIELRAQLVFLHPNPEEELAKLEQYHSNPKG